MPSQHHTPQTAPESSTLRRTFLTEDSCYQRQPLLGLSMVLAINHETGPLISPWVEAHLQGVRDGEAHESSTQTVSGHHCEQGGKQHDAVPHKLQSNGQPPAEQMHRQNAANRYRSTSRWCHLGLAGQRKSSVVSEGTSGMVSITELHSAALPPASKLMRA